MHSETRKGIELTIGIGLTALLSLAYSVYAGRRLGPQEYASFAAAVALGTVGATLAGPVNATVASFAAENALPAARGRVRAYTQRVFRRALLLGSTALGLAVLLSGPLTRVLDFGSQRVTLAALGIAYFTLLMSVPRGLLRGLQRFGPYNVGIVFEAALRLAVGVLLVETTRRAYAGVAAYSIALAATLVLCHYQLRAAWGGQALDRRDADAPRRAGGTRVAAAFTLLTMATAGFQNADLLFAKSCLAAEQAGGYGALATMVRVFTVLAMPFTTLMVPVMAGVRAAGAPFLGPFVRVLGGFGVLAAVPLLCCLLLPREMVLLVYGQAYAEAAPLLPWLAVARVIGYLTDLVALACVSAQQFWVLWVYWPGLAAQIIGLSFWNASAFELVCVVLVTQSATALSMAALLATVRVMRRPAPVGAPG